MVFCCHSFKVFTDLGCAAKSKKKAVFEKLITKPMTEVRVNECDVLSALPSAVNFSCLTVSIRLLPSFFSVTYSTADRVNVLLKQCNQCANLVCKVPLDT